MASRTDLTCACGSVALSLRGKPIISAECLCGDCQAAASYLQSLPGAPRLLDQKGATRFVLYRKDRVRCDRGSERLREYRLSQDSTSRRVVATCCNTPMFLDFTRGHWLSLYGQRWPEGTVPALEIRTMTRDAPQGVDLPGDVPNPRTHTFGFYARLLGAWAAMGFRTPRIDYVEGTLDGS